MLVHCGFAWSGDWWSHYILPSMFFHWLVCDISKYINRMWSGNPLQPWWLKVHGMALMQICCIILAKFQYGGRNQTTYVKYSFQMKNRESARFSKFLNRFNCESALRTNCFIFHRDSSFRLYLSFSSVIWKSPMSYVRWLPMLFAEGVS